MGENPPPKVRFLDLKKLPADRLWGKMPQIILALLYGYDIIYYNTNFHVWLFFFKCTYEVLAGAKKIAGQTALSQKVILCYDETKNNEQNFNNIMNTRYL